MTGTSPISLSVRIPDIQIGAKAPVQPAATKPTTAEPSTERQTPTSTTTPKDTVATIPRPAATTPTTTAETTFTRQPLPEGIRKLTREIDATGKLPISLATLNDIVRGLPPDEAEDSLSSLKASIERNDTEGVNRAISGMARQANYPINTDLKGPARFQVLSPKEIERANKKEEELVPIGTLASKSFSLGVGGGNGEKQTAGGLLGLHAGFDANSTSNKIPRWLSEELQQAQTLEQATAAIAKFAPPALPRTGG